MVVINFLKNYSPKSTKDCRHENSMYSSKTLTFFPLCINDIKGADCCASDLI